MRLVRVVSTGEPDRATLARIGAVVRAAGARIEARKGRADSPSPEPDAPES